MVNNFKLDLEVIAHVAQLVQLAMLTQTDISENMMLMELTPSDLDPTKLVLGEKYKEQANENIERLVQKALELSEQEVEQKEPILKIESAN